MTPVDIRLRHTRVPMMMMMTRMWLLLVVAVVAIGIPAHAGPPRHRPAVQSHASMPTVYEDSAEAPNEYIAAIHAASTPTAPQLALSVAAASGDIQGIRAALQHGARVNGRDHEGHTPFHVATIHGHLHAMRVLYNAHANAEAATSTMHERAIHLAAARGDPWICVFLLEEAGVEVNALTVDEMTALDYALDRGDERVVAVLRGYGGRTGPHASSARG